MVNPENIKANDALGMFSIIAEWLPEAPLKIVDLGCEAFYWTYREYDITRVDQYQDPRIPEPVVIADLNKDFPFDDEEFDCAISSEVIEHLENPRHFIRECKRIVMDFFVITFPNCCSRYNREHFKETGCFKYFQWDVELHGHITPMFPWTFRQACRACNLTIEREAYSDEEETCYIAFVRK